MKIITIGREFGSGGREIGKRLADELGFAYYDREVVEEIAKRTELDESHVENLLDRGFSMNFHYNFHATFAHTTPLAYEATNLLSEQHTVIRQIAERGDCVIVGRGADAILEDMNPLKLFVYADMDSKIKRCQNRAEEGEKLTDKEMQKKIKQIDKRRAITHDIVSDYPWGDRRSYHLCINTTGTEIKKIVPAVAEYAKIWFDK